MQTSEALSQQIVTDYELLENLFGPDYFVLLRIRDKVVLTASQRTCLMELIDDRNHFGIWDFVRRLRK